MIEIDGLTNRYGDKAAVDGLSFVVEPGVVTGFLGPNGAGKSTTMRLIAGLDRPTSGTVRVNGKHYPDAAAPMSELGILLDARSVHPGLSARNNLLALARTAGIGRRRVDEVIELAGLGEVAGTRAGGFSLGMGQRLGVAAALLGQPQTVVLDEPVNGLDPDERRGLHRPRGRERRLVLGNAPAAFLGFRRRDSPCSPRWRCSAKELQRRRDGARTDRSAPLGRPRLTINGQRIVGAFPSRLLRCGACLLVA